MKTGEKAGEKTVEKSSKKKVTAKKPSERKKSAAKRTPDPVPTDPLVFSIADMPSVPALRHALVSWGTGQGHQADQDTALLARELSEKNCHFCGAPSSTTLALGTPWAKVELCECLERVSPGASVYVDTMKAMGHSFTNGGPIMLTTSTSAASNDTLSSFKKKYGSVRLRTDHYQEFFPEWKSRIPEILELARKRILPHSEVIYANQCSCGIDFSVTAGMIVRSMSKHGSHIEMKKCKSCRDALLATSGTKNAPASASDPGSGGDSVEETPKFAKPSKSRKHKKNRIPTNAGPMIPEDPVVASTGQGDATFGDVLGPALARVQETA